MGESHCAEDDDNESLDYSESSLHASSTGETGGVGVERVADMVSMASAVALSKHQRRRLNDSRKGV